jgi:cysteine synthase
VTERADVVVIGGGQAGLATSFSLTERSIDHIVLERARVAGSWRNRWDSFTVFAGTSTGLNVAGAIGIAKELGAGHTVVTVAVDTGLKYVGDLYS